MRFLTLPLLALLVLGRAHSAPAQTIGATSGTINGSIADESGAVLPGVTVTVSGSAQMGTRSMTSDDRGLYRFPNLPPGDYRLMYELPADPVVTARCAKLSVPCEQGVPNKGRRLPELLAQRGIDPAQVIYVGNDVNDLDCLRLVGCGIAVADAHPEVLAAADIVLNRPGGHGAVRELSDRVCLHLSSLAEA